jgi:hypothetical protein
MRVIIANYHSAPPIAVKDANLGLALVEQSFLLLDQAQPLLMQIQALSM